MGRGVILTRFENENVDHEYLGAFRMRVEASKPCNVEAEVFLWQQDPPNPYTGQVVNTFLAVASAVDMSVYPVGAPDPRTPFPFFRLSWFEHDYRATSEAEEAWRVILLEVDGLMKALDRLEKLVPKIVAQVGEACPASDSSASSASASESGSSSGSA